MNTRTVQLSFAGGEISPELYGRPDLAQYRSGAAQLKNWVVKPQGPARTRPGLRWVATLGGWSHSAPRLIPFIYSTGQSLVAAVSRNKAGETVVRFFTRGVALRWAVPFELGTVTIAVNATANTLTGRRRHYYDGDTLVKVLVSAGGDLPWGVFGTESYYVNGPGGGFTTRRFQLYTGQSATGLVSIGFAEDFVGYLRTFKAADLPPAWDAATNYEAGSLVYWEGSVALDQGVYHAAESVTAGGTAPTAAGWHRQPDDGSLEIRLPVSYAQADLDKLVWRQNGDVLTIANNTGTYPLVEIIRGGATTWIASRVTVDASVTVPAISTADSSSARGVQNSFIGSTGTAGTLFDFELPAGASNLVAAPGDVIFVEELGAMGSPALQNQLPLLVDPSTGGAPAGMALWERKFRVDQYYVCLSSNSTAGTVSGKMQLGDLKGNVFWPGPTVAATNLSAKWVYSSSSADTTQEYTATLVNKEGDESLPPDETEFRFKNVLEVAGASNTIAVTSYNAPDAKDRYRIYKKENGLFGYIGDAVIDETTTGIMRFVDNNIAPDLGRTPPLLDTSITGTNYPSAVGGHEQRMFLASTTARPQTVWGSKTGFDTNFTYTLPVQADNRLKFTLASNQAQTVRHIVGMRDLVLLTLSGEFRVRAADDGALTPATIFARQEGYDGANHAQPAALSNHIVYCAARGGHVRKLAYEARRAAFESLSVSLRAPHLFDDFTVTDFGAGKAPFPCVWACSSSGKLLGMTFVPEEKVEGWHQHETAGTFDSIAVVPEGDEDVVYAAVNRRGIDGSVHHTVERIQEFSISDVKQAACLDAHTSTYTTQLPPYNTRIRLDSSAGSSAGADVTLQGRNTDNTNTQVAFDPQDVGKEVHISGGPSDALWTFRVLITGFTNNAFVSGKLLDTIGVDLIGYTFWYDRWRFASKRVYTPAWLAGTVCSVVADSAVAPAATPSVDVQNPDLAYFDLDTPGLNVHAGLPYVCDLQTLPIAAQVEGLGTGREKNIEKAWLRLYESAGLTVGPDADNLQPVTDAQDGASPATGEKRTLVTGKWTEDGQLLVRQAQPFPASVVSLAARVSFGD
jgi:hypothetical protein